MASPTPFSTITILAVVLCGCLAADYGWQPQKEFSFTIQGQDVVGLPQLKLQYAGFRYQGELRVQTHSSRVLLLKFFNMNYSKIHEDLPQGWWKGPEDPTKNKSKQLPITTSTVVVKMTRSMSPELVIQSGLDEWQVNFIKGVVSHLLVYLKDNSRPGHYLNQLTNTQTSDVYSVFEDSVSGRCEVLYEINPLPKQQGPDNQHLCPDKQLWEITKSRNFSNCQLLSEDHAHLPTRDCTPGGGNCGSFWTRASITQMIGCGEMNNLLLLSSVSSSVKTAQLHLKNSTLAMVDSNLNITLDSVLDLKSKFNAPQDKQSMQTLLYSYSATPKKGQSESDEADNSHEPFDPTKQMNPTEEDDEKSFDSREHSKSAFRNKRSIKYKMNKYRSDSNELQREDNSDEQQKSSKGFANGKTAVKKRMFNKFGNYNYKSSYDDSRFISEEKNEQPFKNSKKNKPTKDSDEQLSEETNNQHSEELDLEEHWKISSKDMKKVPPPQPFNSFALAHRNSYDLSCLNTKLQQLVSDIASDLKEINILPEKNTMDKVSMAVDICRSLLFDQLSTISEDVFEVHNGASSTMKKDERKVFRDVITMCGSHPAFKIIKGWIERQQVEGEEAAQMISSLPNHIFSPNKYLIQDFFDMVQQIAEKDDEQLTITAVLSFSNLVRGACIAKASRQHKFSSILTPVCDESYIARYIDWLSHKISSDAPLRRAYIEALGNVGSPHVIEILKSIAVNPKYSSYYRTSAIFAMRYQALKRQPEIAPLLMSLYHNYSMPASARIASAALLVYSEPGLAMWQRLAISTWYEPSSAVSQFVSSTIHNIARAKDSIYSHMTKAAALVVSLARPSKISANRPFNMMTSSMSSDLQKLVIQQISWMQFSDFSNLYYRHSSRYSGFSRTNMEASFSVSNPDDLWSALLELIPSSDVQIPKSRNPGATHTISEIQDTLKLHTRNMPSIQADLHLKINNVMERMISVNKETIQSMAKGGRKLVSEVLREGKSFSYQKTDMDGFHISTTTEMGFPVEFSVRTPWTVRGKTELNVTMDGLGFETAFMYSAQMMSSLSVMSPWDNIAHMAGAYATNFVQLPPLRLVASIDSNSDSIKIATDYIDQHRLLYFNMQPFTSQRKIKVHQPVLLSPDTIVIKTGESIQVPISGLGRVLNTVYSSERREHFNAMDFWKQARGVVGFPMLFTNMEPRSFETVMSSLNPVTANFSLSMASKSLGVLEYDSPRDTLISRVLSSLDKITSFGQSPVMAAFRFFGGLFSDSNEPTTTENPSGDKRDNSQTNKQNSDGRSMENNDGSDSNEASRNGNNPKDEVSTISGKVDWKSPAPQVYSVTYESAEGSFNASTVDPFSSSVKNNVASYLLDQVLSQINSGSAVVYAVDIQSAVAGGPAGISAYVAYASTYSRRVNRFGLFVKRDQSQTKLTAIHEDPVDISSDLKRRVTEDLQHNLFLDFVHTTSNQNIKAFMQTKLGVSRTELMNLRGSPLLESCSQDDAAIEFKCQQLKEQTQQISFGNVSVYYSNDAKFLENMVVKYVNAAKVVIPGTEEKSGEGVNTMSMLVDVDQKTRSVEMSVYTPVTSAKIHRLPLSKLPMSTLAEWATQPDAASEYCGVSSKRFRTFDGRESLYKMKDVWHLVLHDRTRKYGISVLAKPSSNNTMKIEINKDDSVVLRVEEGPKVYFNDKLQLLDVKHSVMVVSDKQGRVVMHIVYTPDSSLRIQLPYDHLVLRYTDSSLVVKAGNALQGRLCGICGSHSNTGVEQYLAAEGQTAKSAKEFASSFQLKDRTSSDE
ncbi:vitellogenin-1-like isoform X1 [Macrosteles quadrilineatus]|uniref:vitellogenin-1-like isoform X1 n=1 Tax=Macrosteles quadrilineatus TaxID=74068 RepID=UPI0023E23E28|nr:vitellogenin-1-like isoform X1 [Macrosteles quadrilineatus]